MELPELKIKDYTYTLPEERIATHPLQGRDQAKLLLYRQGQIEHKTFSQLSDLLPDNSILFFNNTKVIPARFLFQKATGASIEVFLLNPAPAGRPMAEALAEIRTSRWHCAIGNVKRWPFDLVLQKELPGITLEAKRIDPEQDLVEFSWFPSEAAFGTVVQAAGVIPLPPYIRRTADPSDRARYQTVYSKIEGAVAAPTAGLHFTEETLKSITSRGIETDFLSLHVGAGTFLPVKVENAMDHTMHSEQVIIRRENLENLLKKDKKVIAVGTTSLRTLESIYWHGVQLLENQGAQFIIDSFLPYKTKITLPTRKEAIEAVLESMDQQKTNVLIGQTAIYIFPGYRFQVVDGLITNFHQPGSTLLLLIAALLGPDWQRVYREALDNGYRFLSYGDSSLLLPS